MKPRFFTIALVLAFLSLLILCLKYPGTIDLKFQNPNFEVILKPNQDSSVHIAR
jgi:hypothetical protein